MNIPFDTYSHVSTWTATPYRGDNTTWRLEMYDMENVDTYGKRQAAYRFYEKKNEGKARWRCIFKGNDLSLGAGMVPSSEAAIYTMLFFLGVQHGDVEDGYFADYTPSQLKWAAQNAETLSCLVYDWKEIDKALNGLGDMDDKAQENFAINWGVEIVWH